MPPVAVPGGSVDRLAARAVGGVVSPLLSLVYGDTGLDPDPACSSRAAAATSASAAGPFLLAPAPVPAPGSPDSGYDSS